MTADRVAAIVGLVILAAVSWDLFVTALSPTSGAGVLARRSGQFLWRLGKLGNAHAEARRLRLLGPGILLVTVLTWVVLLVFGWWLVALSVDGLEVTAYGRPATAGERLYFVLTTVSTLGPGDVLPVTAWGRVLTAAMAVTGLSLFTLAVTYVLPVVTAATQRRVQATAISALGLSVPQVVSSLDGAGGDADRLLEEVGSAVRLLAQQHLAYPILHYFHSTDRRAAFAPSVATLDEAVTRLAGRSPDPPRLAMARLRAAVDDLLVMTAHHTQPHVLELPQPDDDGLDDVLPCRHGHAEHRHRLAAFVHDDAWDWQRDVLGIEDPPSGKPG